MKINHEEAKITKNFLFFLRAVRFFVVDTAGINYESQSISQKNLR
jgi:hypothetical protein